MSAGDESGNGDELLLRNSILHPFLQHDNLFISPSEDMEYNPMELLEEEDVHMPIFYPPIISEIHSSPSTDTAATAAATDTAATDTIAVATTEEEAETTTETARQGGNSTVYEYQEQVEQLLGMGYIDELHIRQVLSITSGDVNMALVYL